MKTRMELINTVVSIGEDAKALLNIARTKAAGDASLTKAEIRRIETLVRRSEETLGAAGQLAKARREAEIEELEVQIADIDASLTVRLPPDTVEFLKSRRRSLLASLHHKQVKAGLDFGGILTAAEFQDIQVLLADAKHAVARRKKAAGFIKSLFQVVELSGSIVSKASGFA